MKRRDVLLGVAATFATIPSALACENNLQTVVDDIIKDIDKDTEVYGHRWIEYLQSVHSYNKRIMVIFVIPRTADSLSYTHYIVKKIPENITKEQAYIIAGMVFEQIVNRILKSQDYPAFAPLNVWYPASNP